MSKEKPEKFTQYHKDGSVWATGEIVGNTPVGYWEWFRKDGTKMRSGTFNHGIQVGEWVTYDKYGNPYKITDMKEGKRGAEKAFIELKN